MTRTADPCQAAERRAFATRSASVSAGRLVGLAAPFGVTINHGGRRECIARGAFTDAIARGAAPDGRDIIALADHDPAKVLGRMSTGRLTLAETREGLTFALTVADTAAGRDILALAEEGDLGGVSVGFSLDGSQHRTVTDDDGELREWTRCALSEVSVISSWPAYPTTATKRDRLAFLETEEAKAAARRRMAMRLRLAELGG